MKKSVSFQVILLSLVLVKIAAQSELNVLCFIFFTSRRNCFIRADLNVHRIVRLLNLFTAGTEASLIILPLRRKYISRFMRVLVRFSFWSPGADCHEWN